MTGYVGYISKATYYRFKIPSLLPDIDKILYLDCDIILNYDIKELFATDITNYYIAAVPEPGNPYYKEHCIIDGDEYYCNAGVLLINSKKWREDNIEKKLFDFANNPSIEIIYQDQDILNCVLKYHIKYLPLVWNLQHDAIFDDLSYPYHYDERKFAKDNPKLIHFTHKYKPWNIKCFNKYKKLFLKYLKKSPWKNDFYKYKLQKFFYQFFLSIFSIHKTHNKLLIKFLGIKFFFNSLNPQFLIDNINELKTEIFKIHNENNIILKSIEAHNEHQKVFPKYKNINQGREVVLIATGPSLKDFKPIENAVYIGVNKAYQYDKVKFDYLFLQDYSGSTKEYIDDFMKYDCKKFLGTLNYDLEKQCIIPDFYYNNENVERYYTIHPQFKKTFTFDISSMPFGDSYSIVFPAMQFILYTHPKKIYIVGCDCNTSGHFNKQSNDLAVDYVIGGWKRMKEFIQTYYPDIEIVSINPVGLKGMFKDVYTKEGIK